MHSLMEHGNVIWYLGSIEFVHCKATTLVHSIGHLNYEDCLAALKLLPLYN